MGVDKGGDEMTVMRRQASGRSVTRQVATTGHTTRRLTRWGGATDGWGWSDGDWELEITTVEWLRRIWGLGEGEGCVLRLGFIYIGPIFF